MPKQAIQDTLQTLAIELGASGSLHAVAFAMIGELTGLQIAVLGLNGVLIALRIYQIASKWRKKAKEPIKK